MTYEEKNNISVLRDEYQMKNNYTQAVEMALKYKNGYLKLRGVLKDIREIAMIDQASIDYIDKTLKEYK